MAGCVDPALLSFFLGLFLTYAAVAIIPLFVVGLSAHKSISYFRPRSRASWFKRFCLPLLSGLLLAIAGIVVHCLFFAGFQNAWGFGASLIAVAISYLLAVLCVVTWIVLAIRTRRKELAPVIS